jgi:hypothetical protein
MGYAAVLVIEDMSTDFNPFYHSTSDTIGWFNTPYFLEIARMSIAGFSFLAVVDSADSGAHDTQALPDLPFLYPAYPNPFNPDVTFRYEVPSTQEARLAVTDVLGRPVKILFDGILSKGRHRAVWNGIDRNGLVCPSGVYIVSLKTKSLTAAQKIVRVR